MRLLIGNKNWSTWSLRPWLALRRAGIRFDEVILPLRQDDTTARIRAAGSPSGKIPVLLDRELAVWDSLAVCEYLHEIAPQAGLWPSEREARARARSATAEMHSGFSALRKECPMDLTLVADHVLSEDTERDVRRIVELWKGLRALYAGKGEWLVGPWSIADAFFTPVATRFRSYKVGLAKYGDDGSAQAYCELLLSDPDFLEWEAGARAE